ncbi:unnamed protein product [Parnassius apollo]|uniref:(apollo) hypothetical protein n=1 Tax=Parnassius apollo TaxID=110799 RepID=A0A8S3XPR1_PARAO|nr:unnamed protein product [Parnassius apollo]
MEEMLSNIEKCDPKKSRKRKSDTTKWKRKAVQIKRYKSKGLPIFPRCGHDKKAFKCDKLTAQDIRRFHENFYKCKTKISQDNFILKYCTVNKAKKQMSF